MTANTRRSILAVAAGFVAIAVASTGVDILLHAVHLYPPWKVPIDDRLSALATSYRAILTIAGAYLTARLAPDRPMRHALILGCIGTLMGALGAAATWNSGLGPRWYPIALAVLALPECWAGGMLYEARRPRP